VKKYVDEIGGGGGGINVIWGYISPSCLCAAFMCTEPKSAKRQSSHKCLFVLLGSAFEKAATCTLVKLTLDVNLMKIA